MILKQVHKDTQVHTQVHNMHTKITYNYFSSDCLTYIKHIGPVDAILIPTAVETPNTFGTKGD